MKRKPWFLLLAAVLFIAVVALFLSRKQAPLDLTHDEEPFCSIAMPPKSVLGVGYMDGGSVAVIVTDHNGAKHEITFPIDYDGIRNPYPTAFWGNINDPKMIPRKNPERAKEIAIRLLRDHGTHLLFPQTGDFDSTAAALDALSNPPQNIVGRAFEKAKRVFE